MLTAFLTLCLTPVPDGAAAPSEHTAAYPIRPVSLISLCEEADFIGVVSCDSLRDLDGERDLLHHAIDVTVEETWFGSLPQETATVVWLATYCPSPPDLKPGERRVVFLYEESDGVWGAVGRSYGVKALTARSAYRTAVQDWFSIEEGHASALRQARYRWAVGLLDDPELRHEARRLLAGSFWRGWWPGEFSREASAEPAEVWLERLGQVSLLEYEAMPVFVLLHRSDRAVAKSWLLERFEAAWPRVDRDDVFRLWGFFLGLSERSRAREEAIQGLLFEHFFRDWDDEAARAEAREVLQRELRAAIATWADQVSFPVDAASSR